MLLLSLLAALAPQTASTAIIDLGAPIEVPWTQTSQIRAYELPEFEGVVPPGYRVSALVVEATIVSRGRFTFTGDGTDRWADYMATGCSLYWPHDIARWYAANPGQGPPSVVDLGGPTIWIGDPLFGDIGNPPQLTRPLTWAAFSHGPAQSYPRLYGVGPDVLAADRVPLGSVLPVLRESEPTTQFWLVDDPTALRGLRTAGVFWLVPRFQYHMRQGSMPYIPITGAFRGEIRFSFIVEPSTP